MLFTKGVIENVTHIIGSPNCDDDVNWNLSLVKENVSSNNTIHDVFDNLLSNSVKNVNDIEEI